jgi:tRNA(fMet)-specific endonuclease VapC
MSRLSLDTSAYSQFKRNHRAVVELIDAAEWVGVSVVVLGELHTGFGLGKRREKHERELNEFLMNPVVHVLGVDDEAARIYAECVIALRAAGTPLPTNDIWIAAVAAREGARVVTFDEHFAAIGRIGAHVLSL